MPKKLLLADDSVVIQKLVALSFANEDVDLVTTDNGDDAVERAREVKPDLILADVVMPGKSGYEVCEAVRQDAELKHIPVLLLTGTFEAFDAERAQQVQSNGHITKPFEAQALVDRANELLHNASVPEVPAAPEMPAPEPPPVAERAEVAEGGIPGPSFDFFEERDTAQEPGVVPGVDSSQVAAVDQAFEFGESLSPPSLGGTEAPAAPESVGIAFADPNETGGETVALIPDTDLGPPVEPELPTGSEAIPSVAPDAVGIDPLADIDAPPQGAQVAGVNTLPPAPGAGAGPSAPPARDPGAETILADDLFGDTAFGNDSSGDGFEFGLGDSDPGDSDPLMETGDILATDELMGGEPDLGTAPSLDSFTPVPGTGVEPFAGASQSSPTVVADDPLASPSPLTTPPALEDDVPFSVAPSPVNEAPAVETPPPFEQTPIFEPPAAEVSPEPAPPVMEAPVVEAPVVEAPVVEAPVVEAPVVEAPVVAAPVEVEETPAAPVFETTTPEPLPLETPVAAPPTPELEATPEAVTAPEPEAPAPQPAAAAPEISSELVREALEKVAWDVFGDLSANVVKQVVERVEAIAWEVIPQMAEALVLEEIKRMKDGQDD